MRFAHMADCHIGGWRDPFLRDISIQAFEKAVDDILTRKVDFCLIAGDLLHTPLPPIDTLKSAVKKLKELKDAGIPVYAIPGSHDFSPSGKTMLDVFEEAGLLKNVFRGTITDSVLTLEFTTDQKTGAKITGILGKRGMLERSHYDQLDRAGLEKEQGFKIFMLHTAITEMKPDDMEQMDSAPSAMLPDGFSYYAAGHVHIIDQKEHGSGRICYPGPIFPNNMRELEKLRKGGYYLYTDGTIEHIPIEVIKTIPFPIDCNALSPAEIRQEIGDLIREKDLKGAIVIIRLFGELSEGRPSDIDFKGIFRDIHQKGASIILKNTKKLILPDQGIANTEKRSIREIEESAIKKDGEKVRALMRALSGERKDGERTDDFQDRVLDEAKKILLF